MKFECIWDEECGGEPEPTTAAYATATVSLAREDEWVDAKVCVSFFTDGRGVDVDFFRNGQIVDGIVFETQAFRDFLKHCNRISNSGLL